MKGHSKPHAPKTGPGYSAGKAPPRISNSGDVASAKNSAGKDRPAIADPKSKPVMGNGSGHAMLRKPY